MGMASAEGAVRYTFAHAFTPKTPRARTSAPTSSKAAITKALAPPGKFLIFESGRGLGNGRRKSPKRTVRREKRFQPPPWFPTSDHRSDIHESRCPLAPPRCVAGWESRKL